MILKDKLKTFLSVNDRYDFIISYLNDNSIKYKTQSINSFRNIFIDIKGINQQRTMIFTAHYDKFSQDIQAANDNSSSVIVLLELAIYLYRSPPPINIIILFNDNEEKIGGIFNSIVTKSAKKMLINNIGSLYFFKNLTIKKPLIFIVELAGIGNALFFANKSGNFRCCKSVNESLVHIAESNDYRYKLVDVGLTDMFSVSTLNLNGTVIGSVDLLAEKNEENWRINHSIEDSLDKIDNLSLERVYRFILLIINQSKNFNWSDF